MSIPRRSARAAARIFASVSLVLTASMLRAAQQLPPGINYAGQPVVSVDLIARPTMNIDPFRHLVTQPSGAPYSQKLVDQSRDALVATHQFSRVQVNVTPQAGGLRVEFIMQPAYYLGVIQFPGATKVFNYPQLLETVNYPVEEPYEQGRVEHGRQLLQRFLVHNGYFKSSVATQVQLDSTLKLATVIYNVTLNERAKLGKIRVTGTTPEEASRLEGDLHSLWAWLKSSDLKSGQRYNARRLQSAEAFLRSRLGGEDHLASTIKMAPPQYDAATNRADLDFNVTIGPKVVVRVTGAKVSHRELKKLVPIYQVYAVDRELAGEGQENLLSKLQSKGYFDARVRLEYSSEPDQIAITYAVDLGSRHKVAAVKIAGNHHIDEDPLEGQIVVKKAHFLSRGAFSQQLLDSSVNNLEAYYKDRGFLDVKVIPKTVDHEPNLDVTFQIEEGPQTKVESVNVEGNRTEPIGKLAPQGLTVQPDAPFSQSAIREDRNRIVASYLDLGYPNVSFRSTAAPAPGKPHRVVVTYQIDEGTHVSVGAVEDVGYQHTKASTVARAANIKSGAPLSEGKLLGGESELYNLGIFDWADVSPRSPPQDQSSDDVLVRVHEAKRNSITYGVGFESTPRTGSLSTGVLILPGLPTIGLPSNFTVLEKTIISPQGSIEYSRLNMRGRAETASVSALASTLDQQLSFSYTDPHFDGTNWKSLLSFSGERSTQNPLFTARLGQASFQLSRALNASGNKRVQFEYDYQRTSLTNLLILNFVPPEDQNIHLSTFSASFVNDTRDKPLDAHRGVFQTVNLGFSPTFFGSSDNVARFFGQTAFYKQVEPWLVWANNFRLGLVSSFAGSHVPFSERFFSGGADSLRGFPLNGAGPQATALLCTMLNDPASCTAQVAVPTGGHQLFIFNSEGRFPLPIPLQSPVDLSHNLGGVIFYDGGNVYEGINLSHFFSGYSNTVGVGLRYNTPVGPIRFDIGRNLNPVPGQNATQVFVTLGQQF
jgi:outer membrane protein insertion porin family